MKGPPAGMTRDVLTLAEYPFCLLSKRGDGAIHVSDEGPDGKPCSWTVSGGTHGMPRAGDEAVYLAAMQLARETGFRSPRVTFAANDLLARIGWGTSGRSYAALEAALLRLRGVEILARGTFWDAGKKRRVTLAFGIFDAFTIAEKRGETCEVVFSAYLWPHIAGGGVKKLDLGTYVAIPGAVGKRLYRFLDARKYDGKREFRIGLRLLAHDRLGMPRSYSESKILRFLEDAHSELVEVGFLERADVAETDGRVVTYRFPKARAKREDPRKPAHDPRTALRSPETGRKSETPVDPPHSAREGETRDEVYARELETAKRSPLAVMNPERAERWARARVARIMGDTPED